MKHEYCYAGLKLIPYSSTGYDTESDEMRLGNRPGHNLFLTAITFTGQFEFKPSTNSARIFTASLAFWSLIIMSAYTANLASFLVVQNTPSITINTVEDAVRNNYRICVIQGTSSDEAMAKAYPEARVVKVSTEEENYSQLRNGMCDISLNTVSSWEEYRMNRNVNGDCSLTWIGRNFKDGQGGFATKSDSGTLCTSLIRDVFNLHLLEMKADGFVERAWADHLKKQATVNCDAALSSDDDDASDGQLSLQAMGGTFIIHFIATAIAILLAITARLYHHKSILKRPTSTSVRHLASKGTNGADAVERAPSSNVDGWSAVENETTSYQDSAVPQQFQEMLREQNEKLSALSQQNAEMLQMMNSAIKSGIMAGSLIETTEPLED